MTRALSPGRGAVLQNIVTAGGMSAGLAQRHTARIVRELREDGLLELVALPTDTVCVEYVLRATAAGLLANDQHQAARLARKRR